MLSQVFQPAGLAPPIFSTGRKGTALPRCAPQLAGSPATIFRCAGGTRAAAGPHAPCLRRDSVSGNRDHPLGHRERWVPFCCLAPRMATDLQGVLTLPHARGAMRLSAYICHLRCGQRHSLRQHLSRARCRSRLPPQCTPRPSRAVA